METIRILHIVPNLAIASGVTSVIMNYYRHINKEKIQFDFLYFIESDENVKEEILELGGRMFNIGRPSFGYKFQKSLDQFFKEHQGEFKVLHSHIVWAPSIFSYMAKKNGIKYVIAHSHTSKYSEKYSSALRNYILNLFIGFHTTHYLACSKEASKIHGKLRTKTGQVTILNNGIDCKKFTYNEDKRDDVRSELQISPNEIVVGHVGRFVAVKNHTFILKVFSEIYQQDKNYKLMLVGGGELLNQIKHQVSQYGLTDRVIFTGSRSDVPALLSAMDLFLFPSLFEGLGVALVEAQASGLLCVASTAVPKEAKVTDLVDFISLSESAEIWGERIKNRVDKKHRESYSEIVKEKKFDIVDVSRDLEEYCLNL